LRREQYRRGIGLCLPNHNPKEFTMAKRAKKAKKKAAKKKK